MKLFKNVPMQDTQNHKKQVVLTNASQRRMMREKNREWAFFISLFMPQTMYLAPWRRL